MVFSARRGTVVGVLASEVQSMEQRQSEFQTQHQQTSVVQMYQNGQNQHGSGCTVQNRQIKSHPKLQVQSSKSFRDDLDINDIISQDNQESEATKEWSLPIPQPLMSRTIATDTDTPGEIIYSRVGFNNMETPGFLHLLYLMTNC